MKLNEYQEKAFYFAKYDYSDYPFLALTEEVGEVMGKLAKHVRKHSGKLAHAILDANEAYLEELGTEADKALHDDLKKELGDVLWQLSACCQELNLSLEEVAKANLDKLSDRDNRGVIVGEGDER